MYRLIRTSDQAGDSGPVCQYLSLNELSKLTYHQAERPQVGWAVKVGSLTGRSYSSQDWWCTTPIVQILSEETLYDESGEESGWKVIFLTRSGSEYILESC